MTIATTDTPGTGRPRTGASQPTPPRRTSAGPLSRIGRTLTTHWYAWAMVLPVVVVLAVLVGYPLGRGIYLSLTDATEANVARNIGANHIPATYHFVGLHNFVQVLSGRDGAFYGRLWWTVVWTSSCVFFQYTIGLGLANLLNRRLRFRAGYRVLLILPWAVPAFVATFCWRLLLGSDQHGLLNALLLHVGVGPVDWLGDPLMQKISVIAVNVWLGVPFIMVAMLGGLQSIPSELHEAAEVDGASPWQRFRNVTLPGLRPISMTVILLGVIWTFNMFPVIYLLFGPAAGDNVQILATYAYEQAFSGVRDYAGASTYGVIILSLLIVFAGSYRRMLNREEATR